MKKYIYKKVRVDSSTPKEVLEKYKTNIYYDPVNGELKNLVTGTIYKAKGTKGYLCNISIRFNNIEYNFVPHRLIWWLINDEILDPNIQIDHINGIKTDNRILNLRKCSNGENQRNTPKRGSIPFKGVGSYFEHSINCIIYVTSITIGDGRKVIGKFKSPELAAKFYDSAARYYYKEFSKPNFEEIFINPQSLEDLRNLKKEKYKKQ